MMEEKKEEASVKEEVNKGDEENKEANVRLTKYIHQKKKKKIFKIFN